MTQWLNQVTVVMICLLYAIKSDLISIKSETTRLWIGIIVVWLE